MSQQPQGSPGESLVPTHWPNNAGKLTLLTGLFHNLRKRRKRREGSWGRYTPHSLPLGLLLTLTSPLLVHRTQTNSSSEPCSKGQRVMWV